MEMFGPVVERDGLQVREVLGDWSHLSKWDRPPKFIVEDHAALGISAFDRSEARLTLKQTFAGKPIAELKGIHSGKVALLFNGASMGQHDLFKITTPIIGMNRTHLGYPTYRGPQPTYLCVVDHLWLKDKNVLAHPKIINGSTHKKDVGYRVTRHPRMGPFSFDLERDGYVAPAPATTGHLALQFAVYLGFTELYCLGWDLKGGHFDGTHASNHFWAALAFHKRQAKLLVERGIRVFLCGSPDSAIDFYPHAPFEAVCA
jgi:hypothetical protein